MNTIIIIRLMGADMPPTGIKPILIHQLLGEALMDILLCIASGFVFYGVIKGIGMIVSYVR